MHIAMITRWHLLASYRLVDSQLFETLQWTGILKMQLKVDRMRQERKREVGRNKGRLRPRKLLEIGRHPMGAYQR